MRAKDGNKQDRQRKKDAIAEQRAAARPAEEFEAEPYAYEGEDSDPERAWKLNPNPWAGWDEEGGFASRRTFVREPDPTRYKDYDGERDNHSFRKQFLWKLALSMLVFAGVWGLFRYDTDWALRGQELVKQALTDEIDFAAAAAWYKDTFAGAPSFIPIFQDNSPNAVGADGTVKLPVVNPLPEASLVRTFAELLNGVELAGSSGQDVLAAETGRVLLLTDDEQNGVTLVIQHANQRVSVYGMLGEAGVKANDWVEAGDPIGQLKVTSDSQPSLLYFAVKQNEQYIDPVGVIPFD
ncbi:M23 family metallopeptidase [Paenibacillus sp. N4]|uniref:M23 family metallopeptidase n=1 Tax=Paenibacillus vietnamensis TaxID=2590547 RepID=UPI001CD0625F|nr:M23 family metallopeptidase [Paenibacillus vietnamensis]MCA0755269.1 M23 family metallopeptidase [Paenibacillus vietnamensis]